MYFFKERKTFYGRVEFIFCLDARDNYGQTQASYSIFRVHNSYAKICPANSPEVETVRLEAQIMLRN
jgi:hypothetical protein